jgi:hypothetical protein
VEWKTKIKHVLPNIYKALPPPPLRKEIASYIYHTFADRMGRKHCKKRLSFFPSSAVMSLTKLSLAGNNLIFPFYGEFGQ